MTAVRETEQVCIELGSGLGGWIKVVLKVLWVILRGVLLGTIVTFGARRDGRSIRIR